MRRRTVEVSLLTLLFIISLLAEWSVGAAPAKKTKKTDKDLILLEITAIQKDVAKDRWTSAWARSLRIAAYWAHYRHTHPGLKKGGVDRFTRSYRNLQSHLRHRAKLKVYIELGILRAIVITLKV
ncbi:MAG: hypothetical protein GX493_12415 [Firmicutes bacterium]|nr:hypothetical protein [Bacillota bacterium]